MLRWTNKWGAITKKWRRWKGDGEGEWKMNLKGIIYLPKDDKESERWVNISSGVVMDTTFLSQFSKPIWVKKSVSYIIMHVSSSHKKRSPMLHKIFVGKRIFCEYDLTPLSICHLMQMNGWCLCRPFKILFYSYWPKISLSWPCRLITFSFLFYCNNNVTYLMVTFNLSKCLTHSIIFSCLFFIILFSIKLCQLCWVLKNLNVCLNLILNKNKKIKTLQNYYINIWIIDSVNLSFDSVSLLLDISKPLKGIRRIILNLKFTKRG